ncbi:MAG: Ig-like domain-containing protein [Candidatus Odinarchaeota archaeon]
MKNKQLRNLWIVIAFFVIVTATVAKPKDQAVQLSIEEGVNSNYDHIEHIRDVSSLKTANIPPEDAIAKTNVLKHGSFEEVNTNGAPKGWSSSTSIYGKQDFAYQEEVYNGDYSGLVEAKGTLVSSGDESAHYSLYDLYAASLKLTENLNYSQWYKISMTEGDLMEGGTVSVRVRIIDGGNWRSMYYYLSYSIFNEPQPGWNSTNECYFSLNQSLSQWQNFARNISSDYEDAFSATLTNQYVRDLYFTIHSPDNASGLTRLIIDDVSLKNGTDYQYMKNGDFENGNHLPWETPGYTAPGSVTLTGSEATDGSNAVNLSCSAISSYSNGRSTLYHYFDFDYPRTYYPDEPGSLLVEFDWLYKGTDGGYEENAYIYFYLSNESYSTNLYCYLGRSYNDFSMENNTQASYSYIYFTATAFGSRGSWQHQRIDLYDFLSAFQINNELAINFIEIRASIGYKETSSVELLIDNFKVISYPSGDPGFEKDWYDSATPPLAGWIFNNYPYANITAESRTGNLAVNVTSYNDINGGIYRDTYVEIDNKFFTAFWWRLNTLTSGSNTYSYFTLTFEGGYYLDYYIAHSAGKQALSNSTYTAQYAVDSFNDTGSWHSIYRNVTNDLNATFGEHVWNLTRIGFFCYAQGGEKVSAIVDDFNFVIESSSKPEVAAVTIDPSPIYNEKTRIRCEIIDLYNVIDEVEFFYRTDSTWLFEEANQIYGNIYEVFFPIYPFDTAVQFYINITDNSGNYFTDDNSGIYYSYIVGDFDDPAVTITKPLNNTSAAGEILITVAASDTGSAISHVEIYEGIYLLWNGTSAPYEYVWNTRAVTNGTYSITAIAYDSAGNSASNTIIVEVQNDVAPPLISGISLFPVTPVYTDPCTVTVGVIDASSVKNASLWYKLDDGSWQVALMISSGPLYSASIPAAEWGTNVTYYVTAYDIFEQQATSSTFNYVISDDIIPVINVYGPPDGAVVMGIIDFTVSGYDDGSGVDDIEIFVDGSSTWSSSTVPASFSWDTTAINNGNYSLAFRITDRAGNYYELEMSFQVSNPKGLDAIGADLTTFLQNNGVIVGAAGILILYGLIKILKWRRGRKG